MSASQATALRSLAEPVAVRHDCDLEDVVIRRAGKRRLVRLVVDARDGGLTLDQVAAISRDLSRALDDSSILGNAPYVLEVSSPGVDRPLREHRHWERAVGRLVRVTPRVGEPVEGRLTDAGPDTVELDVGDRSLTLALADVARASVQVEFARVEDVDLAEVDNPDHTTEEG